jgi:hypothetical protein
MKYHIYKLIKSDSVPVNQYDKERVGNVEFSTMFDAETYISKNFLSKSPEIRSSLGYSWYVLPVEE